MTAAVKKFCTHAPCLAAAACALVAATCWAETKTAAVSFNRDIRPILTENCFYCHGPDANHREADLRLDKREVAVELGAVTPGDADSSELVRRIESEDADERMPPADSHKQLTAEQKALLRRWIAEGAVYQQHWSYEPPVRPKTAEGANAIDALVAEQLKSRGLEASAEADRRTLIRRLSFDLIGLPPKPEEVDAFANDPAPDAYERLVDRLLASPHFGERMALPWLDVVRYADTIGYHSDNPRNVWPYRDYVIKAFNENKPFDQFTIEQLAGDLLPESTQEQKVASCFNRLLLTTQEGGAQPKDYEARMLADRVRAVGTVWLGQTFGCCQCHDHKFDPMTQRDFYSLGAFFADIAEPIIGSEPGMLAPTPEQAAELKRRQAEAAELRAKFDATSPELAAAQEAWEKVVLAEAEYAKKRKALTPSGQKRKQEAKTASVAGNGFVALPPKEIIEILRVAAKERTPEQQAKVTAHFKSQLPELAELRTKKEAAEKAAADFENSLPRCLVSSPSATPRTVHILPRGNWMDESGPVVQPALPHFLPHAEPPVDQRLTRLDLAHWIVSRDNPLTARVFVNRLWKQFFGIGLSKTLDDLGSQGEWPVQPELLDWLAVEFMDSGWDVKHMVRTIVTSKTYRQVSTAPPELLVRDPDNRWLARQSRFRLDAELVRDNALAVSGLLVSTIGGPSVKPYQPDGYWESLNFPPRTYEADKGPNQYRRGLYTWWQRSFLHPSLLAFDAPSREECAADRPRSNIPQQALVLLNDPTYVEAARALAARMIAEGGADPAAKVGWAWRQTLDRMPRDEELAIAASIFEKHRAELAADPAAANALLKVGQTPLPEKADPVELAAWTSVARLVLNLHETIVRN
jgi:hypothetical protein